MILFNPENLTQELNILSIFCIDYILLHSEELIECLDDGGENINYEEFPTIVFHNKVCIIMLSFSDFQIFPRQISKITKF